MLFSGVLFRGLLVSCLIGGCAPLNIDEPAFYAYASPREGADHVRQRTAFEITFSEPLLPSTVHSGTVSLWSGATRFGASVSADPVLPGLRIQPLGLLEPEVEYELRIGTLRDLDGQRTEPLTLLFTTGVDATRNEPRSADWAEANAIFSGRCAPCHDGSVPLDLSSAEGVRRTAIGAQMAGSRLRSPSRGLAGLEIVSTLGGLGRPAFSYLLYKVLRDPHITGDGMPPGEPLTMTEIQVLAHWIEGGAPTE